MHLTEPYEMYMKLGARPYVNVLLQSACTSMRRHKYNWNILECDFIRYQFNNSLCSLSWEPPFDCKFETHYTTVQQWGLVCWKDIPDSKWKLCQHWVLSCNFRWANVGCAMQNHPHFAHPKNVGPTCCTNVGPTCCINVGPTCRANVGSLLASGSC